MVLIILIAFFSLIGLIVLHEFGHFILAKKFGVRVEEFGIGYPPRLIGKKIGEGSQGTVHLVELDNIPNVQLSIKVYPKKLLTGSNDLTQCINEIKILE